MTDNTPASSPEPMASTDTQGEGSILPKVGKYGLLVAGALIVFGVMQGRHGISCDSADARQTVGEIAKENTVLLRSIRYGDSAPNLPSDQVAQAWDNAVKKLQYDLQNVIMTASDKDTGGVTCKADIVAQVPDWGTAQGRIAYTVEKTSTGDLYATVLDIKED